jgi:hypothetical protein
VQFQTLVRHKKLSMETSTDQKSARVTREEMPASPDAGFNNREFTSADVIRLIPTMSPADLRYLQGAVDNESIARTAEGQGTMAFRKAFRSARRAVSANVATANDMLAQIEGALEELFDGREAAAGIGARTITHMGDRVRVSLSGVVKDPRLGRLTVLITADCRRGDWHEDRARILIKNRWGRIFADIDGDEPSDPDAVVAQVIDGLAYWAARQ